MVPVDFYRGRRVLVTGHTGFKGAWLCTWLEAMGSRVLGFALPPATRPSLFEVARLERRIHSVFGDVRDQSALGSAFAEWQPEVVFHLAAQSLVGVGYQEPVETFSTNVVGTATVLEACRATPSVRAAVVVTSDKCYENHGRDRGYVEDDPLGGHDPYSASKGCQELVSSSYRRSFFSTKGVGLATVRAGNVIGGGDFTVGRLVPDCLRAFEAGCPVKLRYPDAVRPWQHVLEPLAGYLMLGQRLVEDPETWSGAWNFGPDASDSRPVREVVDLCAAAWGSPVAWEREAVDSPHEAAVLLLDSSRARARLGWRPAWSLEAALERAVGWHRVLLRQGDVTAAMRAQLSAHETDRG